MEVICTHRCRSRVFLSETSPSSARAPFRGQPRVPRPASTVVRLFSNRSGTRRSPRRPARALGDVGVAPAVDLGAREAGDVAAEPVADPVAGRHAGDVPLGQRPAHRPAGGQRALSVRPGPRGARRVADEVRVLLADDAEASARRAGARRRSAPGRPGSEASRSAARVAQTQPFLSRSPSGGDRSEPWSMPRTNSRCCRPCGPASCVPSSSSCQESTTTSCAARVADRVAVAPADLDAPAGALGGREPKQLGQVRDPAREAAADASLLVAGQVAPLPGRGARLGLEHRRVAAAGVAPDQVARIAVDAVGADVDARSRGHAGRVDGLDQPRQIVELEVGEEGGSDWHWR